MFFSRLIEIAGCTQMAKVQFKRHENQCVRLCVQMLIGVALMLFIDSHHYSLFAQETPKSAHASQVGDIIEAESFLRTCDEAPVTIGSASLIERPSEEGIKLVMVDIGIEGLSSGKHAVHIHETAKCEPCGAAGGHFDPGPDGNTSPDGNHPFHAGDLINISVDEDGNGHMQAVTSRITLSDGPLSVFDEDGSAIIVHVESDTYCPKGATKGCAGGDRAACGIIEKVE